MGSFTHDMSRFNRVIRPCIHIEMSELTKLDKMDKNKINEKGRPHAAQ